jgi:hypothetical protein
VLVVVVDGHHDRLRLGLRFAQRGDHVDARAVGQAEVDQRHVELDGGDELARIVHAGRFRDEGIRKHLQHELLEPGPYFRKVFEQQDVGHGGLHRYVERS